MKQFARIRRYSRRFTLRAFSRTAIFSAFDFAMFSIWFSRLETLPCNLIWRGREGVTVCPNPGKIGCISGLNRLTAMHLTAMHLFLVGECQRLGRMDNFIRGLRGDGRSGPGAFEKIRQLFVLCNGGARLKKLRAKYSCDAVETSAARSPTGLFVLVGVFKFSDSLLASLLVSLRYAASSDAPSSREYVA